MTLDKSVRQIWLLWIVALCLGAVTLSGLVAAARRGDYLIVVIVPVALVAMGAYAVWRQRVLASLFKQPSLDRVLEHYRKALRRVPQADLMLAYTSALASAYYGDFARAEEFLGSVRWDGRGRFYEALPLLVEALILFWRDKAYRRGLALARRGQDLADVSGALPGADTSRLACSAVVAVGEVLAGEASQETMQTLERASRELPLMGGSLLATWGIAVSHAQRGEEDEAAQALEVVRRAAPHCAPLLSLPP